MAKIRLDQEKNRFIVEPQGAEDMIKLMALPARRWMKRARSFVVPITRTNCALMLNLPLDDLKIAEYIRNRSVTKVGERPFPSWYQYKTDPFTDQKAAVLKCYRSPHWALYMRMGTGKSKAAIDMATAAFLEGQIDSVVVISKLSLRGVWTAANSSGQLTQHSPIPVLKVLVDSNFAAAEIPAYKDRLTWLHVGIESLSQGYSFDRLLPFVQTHRCAVIVDEAQDIANLDTIRTGRIIELGVHAKMRGIMTGTPITKNLVNLHPHFQFLNPDIIGIGDTYAFKKRYCVMGGYKQKEIVGYSHVDELMGLVEPYVYICDKPKGLPAQLFKPRYVQLSREQREMYRKLRRGEIAQVSVANVLNLVGKCQEIVGGFLRADPLRTEDPLTGREHVMQGPIIWELDPRQNPKLQEIDAILEETGGSEQLLIWAKYRWEIDQIVKCLKRHGRRVGEMHGGVKEADRETAKEAFQAGNLDDMVATQQVGGAGHTLVASHLAIFYSNTRSIVDRLQAEDRIHRHGQTENCLYVDLFAERTVDTAIQNSIQDKKDLDEYVRTQLKNASKTLDQLLGEG